MRSLSWDAINFQLSESSFVKWAKIAESNLLYYGNNFGISEIRLWAIGRLPHLVVLYQTVLEFEKASGTVG